MRRRGFCGGFGAMALAVGASGCRREPGVAVSPEPSRVASEPASLDADPWAALAGACDGVPPADFREREGHHERLRAALTDAGHDALVVEPGATMQYLAGVRWGRSERPFLLVLPRTGSPWWIVPAFEERTAREQLEDAELRTWHEHASPYAAVAAGLTERGLAEGTVAVGEQLRNFVVEGLRGALGAPRVVDGTAVVQAQRMRKQPAELARLRRANEVTKAALRLVARTGVEEGMRQSMLAERIRAAQERAGLSDVWALVLFGPNAAFPHGTAHDRPLATGDLILVDTGGALHGYRSDITRTWAFGPVSAAARTAWDTVAAAQRAALETIAPGVTCGRVDAAARAVIDGAGFGPDYHRFTHRLGHGIGLEVHEPPYLVRGSERVLQPGMTMSNEPGIYVPGELGVRIEDIVAVTADGVEVFGPMVTSLDEPFGPEP